MHARVITIHIQEFWKFHMSIFRASYFEPCHNHFLPSHSWFSTPPPPHQLSPTFVPRPPPFRDIVFEKMTEKKTFSPLTNSMIMDHEFQNTQEYKWRYELNTRPQPHLRQYAYVNMLTPLTLPTKISILNVARVLDLPMNALCFEIYILKSKYE